MAALKEVAHVFSKALNDISICCWDALGKINNAANLVYDVQRYLRVIYDF